MLDQDQNLGKGIRNPRQKIFSMKGLVTIRTPRWDLYFPTTPIPQQSIGRYPFVHLGKER